MENENKTFFGDLVKNRRLYVDNRKKTTYDCECIECGHEKTSTKHCKDTKCSKCGGEMRRKDRPGTGKSKEENNE